MASRDFKGKINADSTVIDIALALAAASEDGLQAMGQVLAAAQHTADDTFLWSAIQFLTDRLPDNDPDSVRFTRVLRNRAGVVGAAESISASALDNPSGPFTRPEPIARPTPTRATTGTTRTRPNCSSTCSPRSRCVSVAVTAT
ncbi:hypothetical protein ACWDSD_37095 [Streptomyces spiralis]